MTMHKTHSRAQGMFLTTQNTNKPDYSSSIRKQLVKKLFIGNAAKSIDKILTNLPSLHLIAIFLWVTLLNYFALQIPYLKCQKRTKG